MAVGFKVTIVLHGEAVSLADVDDEEAAAVAWDKLEDGDGVEVTSTESDVEEE